MSPHIVRLFVLAAVSLAFNCARAQWVAYNDHAPGTSTAAKVSTHSLTESGNVGQPAGGPLIHFATGAAVPVGVAVSSTGHINGTTGSATRPATGTPADVLFSGKIDWSNSSLFFAPSPYTASVTLTFTNLTPGSKYAFRGVAHRGGSSYVGRWTVVTLAGAAGAIPAHQTGSGSPGIITNGWAPYGNNLTPAFQAAVNSGRNLCGDLIGWDQITPLDSSFSVICSNYRALVASGAAVPGGTIEDNYAYAFSAFKLEEFAPDLPGPAAIVTPPSGGVVLAGQPFTFSVGATGYPIRFQWRKNGATLPGVTNAEFTLPATTPSDSGAYTVLVTGSTNSVESLPVQLTVWSDLSQPLVTLTGSVWRYNQTGQDLGSAWKEPAYDDSAWPSGRGVMAWEDHTAIIRLTNTILSLTNLAGQRIITYYFRTPFTLADPSSLAYLSFSNLIDDGCIVWINGKEAYRFKMPAGPVSATNQASANSDDGVFNLGTVPAGSLLVAGTNMMAVEVHQYGATSSDVVMGVNARATPWNSGPVMIVQPPQHLAVRPGAPAVFEVSAAGMPPLSYQWFKDNVPLADSTALSGLATPVLTLASVSEADLGAYSVAVSNILGVQRSAAAGLTLAPFEFVSARDTLSPLVMTADDSGHCWVAGDFRGPAEIGGRVLTNLAPNVYDFFVAKYDPLGRVCWVDQGWGTNGSGWGFGLALDPAGNLFLAGHFAYTTRLGDFTLASDLPDNAFLAKYDPEGRLLWAKKLGQNSKWLGRIAVDRQGFVYFTTENRGTESFDAEVLTSAGDADLCLVKLDNDGNVLWARNAGGIGFDSARGVAVDSKGSVYVSGNCTGSPVFGGTPVPGYGDWDIFLAKYSADGVFQWARVAGGAGQDEGTRLAVDSLDRVYLTGYFSGTAQFDTATLVSQGGRDGFLAQYDKAGERLWLRQFGGAGTDGGWELKAASQDLILLSGLTTGTASFGTASVTGRGGSDLFVAAWDGQGRLRWLQSGGGAGNESGDAMAPSGASSVYVATGLSTASTFGALQVAPNPQAGSTLLRLIDPGLFPAITTPPAPQAALPGDPACFTVCATGAGPLACQWLKDGVPLADNGRIQGAATLRLDIASVEGTDTGLYSVVVTNLFGSAASAPAALRLRTGFDRAAGALCVSNGLLCLPLIGAASNQVIVLETSTNLIDWEPLLIDTPWSSCIDWKIPVSGSPMRFFRANQPDVPANPSPSTMVWIPEGAFLMGSPLSEADRSSDELQHPVRLSGFYMSRAEVTQGEYLALTGANPSTFTGDLKRPVENVSWADATNYCHLLNLREGRLLSAWAYRLPTEAEWEYACRAGTTTPFHYGQDLLSGMANFDGRFEYTGGSGQRYNPAGARLGRTAAAGSYPPNAFGLYDMHGNVWEWCWDAASPYPAGSVVNPRGSTSGSSRAIRGGYWDRSAGDCRSAQRDSAWPESRISWIGFRIVLAPVDP